jgi:hypothetical protein
MKPISSVGTNAAKCVTKLCAVNAVLIVIALHSISHFQILAKIGLSVKDDGEANNCSVSHIPTLLVPKDFITFFTRKCEVGHLMLVYQSQSLLNIK